MVEEVEENGLRSSSPRYDSIGGSEVNTTVQATYTIAPDNPSTITTKFVFQVILLIIVGSIGLAGNIKGIINIARIERPSKFQSLMATLFVFDAFMWPL